jgi:hypothetical protein
MVAVTGSFATPVDFGGGPLSSVGSYDGYVATYSAQGTPLWSRRVGGTQSDEGLGVALDGGNNVILTGSFQGTANVGGGNLTSAGNRDVFLAKYAAASGAHLWSQRFGGSSLERINAVAVDGAGNIALVGYFVGTTNFGGGPLTAWAFEDIIVAKYTAAGAPVWSQRFGRVDNERGTGVTIDPAGNVVTTGYFFSFLDFGDGLLFIEGYADTFLLSSSP